MYIFKSGLPRPQASLLFYFLTPTVLVFFCKTQCYYFDRF